MNSGKPTASRRREKRRFHALSLVAAVAGLIVFIVAAGVLFFTLSYQSLRIAVGPAGSNDAKLIDLMTKIFARERSPIRLRPIITESAEIATTLLREGKADLAVIRSDELPPDAQAIAIMRKNVLVLWAPQGRNARDGQEGAPVRISSIEQLAGRKLGLLGQAPANAALLKIVLSISGVAPEKVEIIQFATSEVVRMAADPTLEAFATIGPFNSRITAVAISATARSRGEPKFLAIDASEALVKKNPQLESVEIPPSSFGSVPARPEDSVATIGLNHLLVARKEVSEPVGTALARQLFADRQTLLRKLPGVATLEMPDTDKDAPIPVHPGAAAYIDGTERTFVEKYSDYFWGALLLLSGVGSARAWFRALFKRDEKARHFILRDRLLELVARVRSGRSIGEIDRLDDEADDILRDTLACYEDGAIEGGQLTAFGLLLDQFRHVASERKRALNDERSATQTRR